jgi:hypothetical protein
MTDASMPVLISPPRCTPNNLLLARHLHVSSVLSQTDIREAPSGAFLGYGHMTFLTHWLPCIHGDYSVVCVNDRSIEMKAICQLLASLGSTMIAGPCCQSLCSGTISHRHPRLHTILENARVLDADIERPWARVTVYILSHCSLKLAMTAFLWTPSHRQHHSTAFSLDMVYSRWQAPLHLYAVLPRSSKYMYYTEFPLIVKSAN